MGAAREAEGVLGVARQYGEWATVSRLLTGDFRYSSYSRVGGRCGWSLLWLIAFPEAAQRPCFV